MTSAKSQLVNLQSMINADINVKQIVINAWKNGIVVPGFNIPYLPMMEPVIRALTDTGTFGLIMVARLEWIKNQVVLKPFAMNMKN